jgi:hypothetical protein
MNSCDVAGVSNAFTLDFAGFSSFRELHRAGWKTLITTLAIHTTANTHGTPSTLGTFHGIQTALCFVQGFHFAFLDHD